MGYLRQVNRRYQIGNTFLLRWFEDNKQTLDWEDTTQQPSDEATLRIYEEEPSDDVTESQKGRGLDPENEWLYEKMLELSQRGGIRELEKVRKQMLGDDWYNEWRKRKKERGANSGLTKNSYRKALTRLVKKG
ncbi:MAG: hypothetical protein ACPGWR_30205 [Ardenticatenaceae bacterium]